MNAGRQLWGRPTASSAGWRARNPAPSAAAWTATSQSGVAAIQYMGTKASMTSERWSANAFHPIVLNSGARKCASFQTAWS
jgi:hypothetical protein